MRKAAESLVVDDGPAPAGTGLVLKALNLIDLIAASPGQHRAQTLADELGLPRSTVYRILNTLQQRGMVRLDAGTAGYYPGFKFLDYAQAVWPVPDLPLLAMVEVRRLQETTGETVYFAVPGGLDMVIIQKAESPIAAAPGAPLGSRRPLHCTGMGKAYLSALPVGEREAVIGRLGFEKLTERTVVDPAQLRSQLDVFRLRGYAIDDEEFSEGSRCVSAAVVADNGAPLGTLAIAGPGFRMTRDRAHLLGPEVAAAARRLGEALRSRSGVAPRGGPGSGVPLLTEGTSFLGRTPAWDAAARSLLWVDALGPVLLRANASAPPAVVARFTAPAPVLAPLAGGRILVATADGCFTGPPEGPLAPAFEGVDPELFARAAGIVEADGALWMAAGDPHAPGAPPGLYRLADGAAQLVCRIEGTPSGLALLPGSRALLVPVSDTGDVLRLPISGEKTTRPRPAFRIDPIHGRPSAIAVDPDGFVWVGLWDGWSLARMRADGGEMRLLPLPVPRPTGLAFGGPAGDILYVTTCRLGLTPQQLAEAPASGGVFAIDRALRAHLLR